MALFFHKLTCAVDMVASCRSMCCACLRLSNRWSRVYQGTILSFFFPLILMMVTIASEKLRTVSQFVLSVTMGEGKCLLACSLFAQCHFDTDEEPI